MSVLRNPKFRLVVVLICIAIIIYESYCLYRDNKQYHIADSEYSNLADDTITMGDSDDLPEGATYPPLYIDYNQLKSINDDYVGWLYFPYFGINYPVVHETEINEYIHKTFDGTVNKSGCLFTDVLSDPDFNGMHDIIFGHNMRNGSMFGKLKQLAQSENRDAIAENPYIYIYTDTNVYQYEVFAFYITKVGSDAYSVVTDDEEYDEFVNFISTHTAYAKPDDLDLSDRPSILTLSTCSGSTGSGKRFVIHAAKINSWDLK